LSPGASDRHRLWVIDKMLDHDVKNKLALVKWSGYAEPQRIPCADIHPDVFKILLRDWRHRDLALPRHGLDLGLPLAWAASAVHSVTCFICVIDYFVIIY